MAETQDFRIGDTVVEPTIGICRIQGIQQIAIDGSSEDYFVFQGINAQVKVPRSQLTKRGIRRPMSRDDIKKIILTLRTPIAPGHGDARSQYLEYQDMLRSGDPNRISKLLRRLFILQQADDLKGKEKELMEKGRHFLVEEITFVQGASKTKVNSDINESLEQMLKKKVETDREASREARRAERART